MNPLAQLARRLAEDIAAAERPFAASHALDSTIETLRQRLGRAGPLPPSSDAALPVLEDFWVRGMLRSPKDVRIVCYSLAVPVAGPHTSVLDDAAKLQALLGTVDRGQADVRRFRRCFQGLMRSYFAFDGRAIDAMPAARQNWELLRVYLADRVERLRTAGIDPDWTAVAAAHRDVFDSSPSGAYARSLLAGDASGFERVCSTLGIGSTSWFVRDVLLGQVHEATRLQDRAYLQHLDRLLLMLGRQPTLRDAGLSLLLHRHVQMSPPTMHKGLANAAIVCWGSPLPTDDAASSSRRWARAGLKAQAMVAAWLKPELIDAFFAGFGDDGAGQRRAAFWKRYVAAIDALQFVLPASLASGLGSRPGDPPLLRRKLEGALPSMKEGDGAALMMRIGSVIVVEFGRTDDGVYVYSDSSSLPFDPTRPLTREERAPNSLRHPSRSLFMMHRDQQQGWATWEAMFEALLKRQFAIEPGQRRPVQAARHVDLALPEAASTAIDLGGAGPGTAGWDLPADGGLSAHWQTAEAGAVAFGRAELAIFARVHALRVEDESRSGGPIRVLTDDLDEGVNWVLQRWNFVYEGAGVWSRELGDR